MKSLISLFFLVSQLSAPAQQLSYKDSITLFQKKYVAEHEIVKGADKDFFRFYPVNNKYRVIARFEKIIDTAGFIMKTSGIKRPAYLRYGTIFFTINNVPLQLTVYQTKQPLADAAYKNYLFVPFTDKSSGEKSYGGGRYLDFFIDDIQNNLLTLDFNKCYNPYCAYATGFNCPIPPGENDLPILLEAGEMNFAKKH